MERKTAFVTGASRGIGKACAVSLAQVGFNIALTSRTVKEGEQRDHSSTIKQSDLSPLPGSLETTADLIRDAGVEALIIPADLLDEASLGAAATTVLERWGGVDVVVHNGRYIGPGHMDLFLDTPVELVAKQLKANVLAPLTLNKYFVPAMIARGGGTIIDITSASGYADPSKPAGKGGWSLGYGVSKGAFHRVAGILAIELQGTGVNVFNINPGSIFTERIAQDMAKFGISNQGAPPEVVASVVAWLATNEGAVDFNGKTIEAQFLCHELQLLPGWAGPRPKSTNYICDESGTILARLEEGLKAQD